MRTLPVLSCIYARDTHARVLARAADVYMYDGAHDDMIMCRWCMSVPCAGAVAHAYTPMRAANAQKRSSMM
jgi:hypothetical protein